mmetsp:Transcript_8580/g.20465  ORF Transcript_8580/g.20465 Transcript_8580/m.20465 type:complete len:213 (+) Transcript_8580:345-983(+)
MLEQDLPLRKRCLLIDSADTTRPVLSVQEQHENLAVVPIPQRKDPPLRRRRIILGLHPAQAATTELIRLQPKIFFAAVLRLALQQQQALLIPRSSNPRVRPGRHPGRLKRCHGQGGKPSRWWGKMMRHMGERRRWKPARRLPALLGKQLAGNTLQRPVHQTGKPLRCWLHDILQNSMTFSHHCQVQPEIPPVLEALVLQPGSRWHPGASQAK